MTGELRDLYQDIILEHGKRPRNFRALPGANREILGHNPLCGDRISLALILNECGTIEDIAFQGSGCAISMASASIMSEILKGMTAGEARSLIRAFHSLCAPETAPETEAAAALDKKTKTRIEALAGVRRYPVRVKCAMLAWRALEAALDQPEEKKVKTE